MNSNKLFNIDIIAPTNEDVKYLGEVSKLNIFEFSGSTEFEPDGLFSTKTFGPIGSTARNETMGYINVGIPILHPKVYQNFMALGSMVVGIIYGKIRAIFKNGEFIEDSSGSTGLYFFLKHWPDMKISDNDSDQRNAMIELNKRYAVKNYLTNNILILPAGMRDYTVKNNKPSEDEINNLYRSLLSASITLKNNSIDINSPNMELYNSIVIGLQEKFVEIYDYIKNILEGKTGYIQNQWSKHGVKDGTRNVITSTSTVVTNLRDTNLVRPTDTIVGLHQYIASISPAAKREIVNFISNVFTGDNNKAYLYNIKTLKPELTEVSYKDINTWTSFEGLDKIIKKFGQDDIKTMPIKFNGKYLGLVRDDGNNVELYFNTEVTDLTNVRPLTYFEFIYLAVYDIRDTFNGILTRFPVESMTSSYFTTIHLKTTTVDRKVNFKFNGVEKEVFNYPLLNSPAFNSMTPHFYRLEGIGGDNDGDQVSLYMLMSDESIEEANSLLFDIKYYIKPDGSLMNNPSIPPADLLMKHLTTTLDTNTIIMQANDLIGVFTKEELIKKLNKISNNNFTTLNNNIYVLLNDKMDVLSYVEYVYLNRNIDNGTDYSYFTETYGKRVRSDGYIVINSFSSDKKTIELFYKILEDDFNGYDSVLEISNLNKEQTEMLTLLNYKKQDKIYIRYAI